MSLYSKLFEAYRKCYCSSLSKEKIQKNVNDLWHSLKKEKNEYPANAEKKIKELQQLKTKKDTAYLSFFTRQNSRYSEPSEEPSNKQSNTCDTASNFDVDVPILKTSISESAQNDESIKANTSQYAHYVFNTLDHDHSGILSFEDFVTGLSILSRGSMDEKLRWTFSLYDINGDGLITRDEMTDIVTAVYELMGKFADPNLSHNQEGVRQKVDRLFQKLDVNKDGVVTLSEFMEACNADPEITTNIAALETAF